MKRQILRGNGHWRVLARHSSLAAQQAFALRDYQQDCVDTIISRLEKDRRAAVSLPTGSGKTVVFSSLISRIEARPAQGTKTLILTSRRELCFQTAETLQKMYPNVTVGLEIGNLRFKDQPKVDICVASIASISRPERLKQFDPSDFKLVIVDEAHHSAADTYTSVLKHFGVLTKMSEIYLVGFSATLFRKDLKPLNHAFDDVFYHRQIEDMMVGGHLCRARITNVSAFDGKLGGRETIWGSNHVLKSEEGVELIAGLWKEYSHYKSTVIFCMDRAHVDAVTAGFRAQGIDARSVDGAMKTSDRDRAIREFRHQKFPVIVNCSVLTEGTDIPCIDQIILARPLASPGLAVQMIGRGLRQFPGKDHCHIIQLKELTNYDEGTTLLPLLEGRAPPISVESESLEEGNNPRDPGLCAKMGEITLKSEEFSMDALFSSDYKPKEPQQSPLAWLFHKGWWHLFCSPLSESVFRLERVADHQWQVLKCVRVWDRKKNIRVWRYFRLVAGLSLSDALVYAEAAAKAAVGVSGMPTLDKKAHWRKLPCTDKQWTLLQKDELVAARNMKVEEITRGAATDLINLKSMRFKLSPALIKLAISER